MTTGKYAAIDHSDGKLIQIRQTGMWIDPMSITALHAIANAQRHITNAGHQSAGKVIIETRNNGSYTIPCSDIQGARKLRDTLALICNERVPEAKKPKIVNGTDYGKSRLMGDANYSDEVRNIFGAFELNGRG